MAATPAFSSHKETALLSNNVNAELYVYQLSAEPVGTTYQSNFFVTMKVSNLIDTPVLVNNLAFNIVFTDTSYPQTIVSVDNYSTDLVLSMGNTTLSTFSVAPSEDFAYGNGVVVPPNSSLYLVCNICIKFNSASFGLSSVTIPQFSSARGNYSYGTAVDFSPLISSLNTYFSQEHLDNNNILTLLGSIKVDSASAVTALSDILSAITYSGSNPSLSLPSGDFQESTYVGSGFTINVQRTFYSGVPLSYDFELNSTSDSPVLSGYYFCPFTVAIGIAADNAISINSAQLILSSMFPSGYRVELTNFISDVFYPWTMDSRLILRYRQQVDSNKSLIPKGRSNTILYGRLYLPIGTNRTLPTLDISGLNITASTYSGYVPRNDLEAWRYFIDSYSGNSNVSDQVSSSASSTDSQLSGIHAQEEALYSQNQTAMNNSGISNFQFDNNTFSAFNAPRTLFERLWASLGPYTVVYTFSMLLTLALVIIRYTNGRKKAGKND